MYKTKLIKTSLLVGVLLTQSLKCDAVITLDNRTGDETKYTMHLFHVTNDAKKVDTWEMKGSLAPKEEKLCDIDAQVPPGTKSAKGRWSIGLTTVSEHKNGTDLSSHTARFNSSDYITLDGLLTAFNDHYLVVSGVVTKRGEADYSIFMDEK